jgi:uncharacterized membrane protein
MHRSREHANRAVLLVLRRWLGTSEEMKKMNVSYRGALIVAATLLGIGLGGFMDGIVFHQILQWHGMVSSIVEPVDLAAMRYNMFWDGVFDASTWVITVLGLALLWRAGQRSDVPWSTRTFVGSLALGWGLFNLIEGICDHHIIRIHHVRPGVHEMAWDLAYLGIGLTLAVVGYGLIRAGRRDMAPRGTQQRIYERAFVGPGPLGTNSGSLNVRTSPSHAERRAADNRVKSHRR